MLGALQKAFYLLVSLWLLGGVRFLWKIHHYEPIFCVNSQAIIVLTGESSRLYRGAQLLSHNPQSHLFISGVNSEISKKDLQPFLQLTDQQLTLSVTLGYDAKNTQGNAAESYEWIKKFNTNSIALVTAHYHMPRSLIEFKKMFQHYTIIPVAVVPTIFTEKSRLATKATILLVEYNKYAMIYLRSLIKG